MSIELSAEFLDLGLMRYIDLMGLPCAAAEADVPYVPLGHRWRRFSLPGLFGESAQPIRLWRRLRRFLGGGRSLNVVCSWGASRRNQAKSGYPDSNVRLWGHSGLSGTPLRMSAYSHNRTLAGVEIWPAQWLESTQIGHSRSLSRTSATDRKAAIQLPRSIRQLLARTGLSQLSSSNNALASLRSGVSKPSVNHS